MTGYRRPNVFRSRILIRYAVLIKERCAFHMLLYPRVFRQSTKALLWYPAKWWKESEGHKVPHFLTSLRHSLTISSR